MTTTITVYITDEDAMGGYDDAPEGADVEATKSRLADLCQSGLAAAYPDAVVVCSTRTEYALNALGIPHVSIDIPWEDMPGTDSVDDSIRRWKAEDAMEAEVQHICEVIWEGQNHWVWKEVTA